MARKDRNRRRRKGPPEDLEPYLGCPADAELGLDPLAVGWLQRNRPYDQGPVPDGFLEQLLTFCFEKNTVCATAGARRCPLCSESVEPITRDGETAHFGRAEIRVFGEVDIFAAPTLIYHYVAEHGYRPPGVFIDAVMESPPPGSPEHRALVKTLNR